MVTRISEPGRALDVGVELAEAIEPASHDVVVGARRLLDAAAGTDLEAVYQAEAEVMRPLVETGRLLATIESFWDRVGR